MKIREGLLCGSLVVAIACGEHSEPAKVHATAAVEDVVPRARGARAAADAAEQPQSQVLEAEDDGLWMRSTGARWAGPPEGWDLWANGAITTSSTYLLAGASTITVVASGTAAQGVSPIMIVSAGGPEAGGGYQELGRVSVTPLRWNEYTFVYRESQQRKRIRVAFSNDLVVGSEDRNLRIDKVMLGRSNATDLEPNSTDGDRGDPGSGCEGVIGLCAEGGANTFGSGKAYFVAPSGSNGGAGTLASPWQTVAFGSKKLRPGDTLYLRAGTYNEYISDESFSASGSETARIYVSGYAGETAVLDSNNSKSTAIALGARQYITFRNLEVRRYARVAIQVYGAAHHNAFEHIYLHDIGKGGNNSYSSGFEVSKVSGTVIRASRLDRIGTTGHHHGVYLSHQSKGTRVLGNWITRTTGGCVHAWHTVAAADTLVQNNLLSCDTWGVVLGDGAHDVSILNNTIYQSRLAIELFDHGEGNQDAVYDITLRNNILQGSSLKIQAGVRKDTIQADHNFTGDPKFIDMAGGKLRLRPDSEAIDAGATLAEVTSDISGTPRPRGRAYDIGAYEQ